MEGAISCFGFLEDDIVFIGDGSCAAAALDDASSADAIPIVLRTCESWIALNPVTPIPKSVIFDTGVVPANRLHFECLAKYLRGSRIFLAGEIPRETGFRPPPILSFRQAAWGETPRRLERRALEDISGDHDFRPSSLHDVHVRNEHAPGRINPFELRRITRVWQEARQNWLPVLRADLRPPFDRIREASETAVVTEEIDGEIYGFSWRRGPFDTAYFDVQLAEAYSARGIKAVILGDDVILLHQDALLARCKALGLDLHFVDASIE